MRTYTSETCLWGIVLLSSTLLFSSGATAEPLNLRLGIVMSSDSPLGAFATTTVEEIKQKSGGRLAIELFDKGQLGGETEMLNSVRQGALDLTLTGSPIVAQFEKSFGVTELPFIWKSSQRMFEVLNGPIGQELLGLLEQKGLKGIAFGDSGPRSLLSRTAPVNGISDVKGLKIRVVENPLYVASWRNFGANPVPMAWPEVYIGLQQGAIDAVDSTPWGTRDAKHYEVAKYIALTNHVHTAYLLVMNLEKWRTVPADLQKLLVDAALKAQKVNLDRIDVANSSAVAMMKKAGIKVTYPDRDQFRAQIGPLYDQFAKSVRPDLLKKVQEANK